MKHKSPRIKRSIALLIVGFMVGALIAIQIRSYENVTALVARDTDSSDLFHEIYTLKSANESLNQNILALEDQLEQYSDQTSAYDTIVAEIEKNELLIGVKPISGSGLTLTVETTLSLEWMVDLTNELWAVGAEAVSVNGVRLTDLTNGFYTLGDLLVLSGTIVETPYTFAVIGNEEVMRDILNQPGGILSRLEKESGLSPTIKAQSEIEMNEVSVL